MGKIRQEFEISRTKKLQESFSGIKEIKTFLLNNIFIKSYEVIAKTIARAYAVRGLILKLPKVFLETLVIIIIILLTIILINGTSDNTKVFALLGVFAVSAIKIIPHVYSVISALNTIKFSNKPINYYKSNLKEEYRKDKDKLIVDLKFNKKIVFDKIYFQYPEKKENLLENLNFEIKKGDRIHLKGVTGSGKSTLIDLLLGLQKPTSGEILVDDKALTSLGEGWFSNISYVPQSIFLFDDNIKQNITLSENAEIDEDHFLKCVEAAELKDFINKLPYKENTQIGEVGSKISGGQKQRIGIARALYKKSEIIILDEATNAVDDVTEKKIYLNLNTFKNKTLIAINHREIPEELNFNKYLIKEKKIELNA